MAFRLVLSEASFGTLASAPGGRSYSTLHSEALKVFSSLQHLEGVADPVPIIQGLLQTGQELRPLRDELYCQLIKQTTRPPQPGGPSDLCVWKILACMCCTFVPTRSILRYLKLHLKRYAVAVATRGTERREGGLRPDGASPPAGPGSRVLARRWSSTPPSPWRL